MSSRMTMVALAAAAMLSVAACGGEEETLATPVSEGTPSAEAPAAADLEAGIEQLQERIGAIEARLDESAAGLEDRIEAIEVRLEEFDPSDLGSRVGAAEAEIERLSEAVQVLQAPPNVGGATADPDASPESASPEPNE